ncbi:hypothetical protein AAE02nite_28010 [Adhaeribacter aerolatus]|uniref:Uncharacterized protein n=1 Tax=Adhaeribacter aerolatus TaxID=670289 RepID=A0A512B031_9BACT|nr:hypothetical protein AAE02nite_28010 [Adhaeribacter aerolatus]
MLVGKARELAIKVCTTGFLTNGLLRLITGNACANARLGKAVSIKLMPIALTEGNFKFIDYSDKKYYG